MDSDTFCGNHRLCRNTLTWDKLESRDMQEQWLIGTSMAIDQGAQYRMANWETSGKSGNVEEIRVEQ